VADQTTTEAVDPRTLTGADLAEYVLDVIRQVDGFWNQGTWRTRPDAVLDATEYLSSSETEALTKYLGKNPNEDPACGTAMCFAGWATQLTGAPFVWPVGVKKFSDVENYGDIPTEVRANPEYFVRVPNADLEGVEIGKVYAAHERHEDGQVTYLAIPTYAAWKLGLDYYSAETLFSGGNTLTALETYVGEIRDHGRVLTYDERQDVKQYGRVLTFPEREAVTVIRHYLVAYRNAAAEVDISVQREVAIRHELETLTVGRPRLEERKTAARTKVDAAIDGLPDEVASTLRALL
jgi:hypothetical protein